MDKVIIDSNFRVFVPILGTDGKPVGEERRDYGKGMVVSVSDIPDGHTAAAWIEKGLAMAPPVTDAAPEAAPA